MEFKYSDEIPSITHISYFRSRYFHSISKLRELSSDLLVPIDAIRIGAWVFCSFVWAAFTSLTSPLGSLCELILGVNAEKSASPPFCLRFSAGLVSPMSPAEVAGFSVAAWEALVLASILSSGILRAEWPHRDRQTWRENPRIDLSCSLVFLPARLFS